MNQGEATNEASTVELIELSPEGMVAFLAMLEAPAEPTLALVELFSEAL